jgi:hypothetical protein
MAFDQEPALVMAGYARRVGRGRRLRTIVGASLGTALLIGEIYFGRGELARAFRALRLADLRWVGCAILCTFVSMQCFARAQRYMLRAVATEDALARLSLGRVVRLTYSANALSTTMPAGGPISIVYTLRQFRTWGLSYAAAAFAVVASGLVSTVTFAALLVACGLATGRVDAAIAVAASAALAAALGHLAHRRFGLRVHTVIAALVARLGKPLARVSHTAAQALETAGVELDAIHPRQRDWAGATGFAMGNWLADLASLMVACQAVPGAHRVGLVAIISAYLAGMSASSVAVLPGGFGVVEIAMIVALHAGGLPTATATAAVLLYRLVSCLLVVVLGWIAMALASATRLRLVYAATERVLAIAEPAAPSEPERTSWRANPSR